MRVVDLSRVIDESIQVYPGDPRPRVRVVADHGREDYRVEEVCMGTHTGTHIDAPLHFIPDGSPVDGIPVDRLVAPGIAVNVRGRSVIGWRDLEGQVSRRMLEGRYLLIDTGWEGSGDYPVVGEDLARILVESGALGLGVDTPSPDRYPYPVHRLLLGRGLVIIENLYRPGRLAGRDFLLVVAPLPLGSAGGAPARVYAIELGLHRSI